MLCYICCSLESVEICIPDAILLYFFLLVSLHQFFFTYRWSVCLTVMAVTIAILTTRFLAGRLQYVNMKALVNVTEIIVVIINITLTLCLCSAQDCSLQAQSNLTFLSILKEPCEELEQLKPSQIASKFKHIVSLIRIIWINSPHYNTSERIVNLFRQVPEMLNSR